MSDLTTTQLKLRTTPTGGIDSEHSPYYRRLLSAGYKGFLQGTIGGATFYGVLGTVIGTLVALPLMFLAPAIGAGALMLIPGCAALGIMKGATTFGNIGSMASITAESAEMAERRRILFDRYYDLPNTPEYDAEAAQIKQLLSKSREPVKAPPMFHLNTMLICAALGAAVCFGMVAFAPAILAHAPILMGAFESLGIVQLGAVVPAAISAAPLIGAGIGALGGATIGLDRWYVRKWLDVSQGVVQDPRMIRERVAEREQEVQLLGRASPIDYNKPHVPQIPHRSESARTTDMPVHPESGGKVEDMPGNRVQQAVSEDRVQQAMSTPVL